MFFHVKLVLKLAKALFLFGLLRLSLPVTFNLNLCDSLVLLFSMFIEIVSILKYTPLIVIKRMKMTMRMK